MNRYPPSDDGGPIEARIPRGIQSSSAASYPPSDDGGPIEAMVGGASVIEEESLHSIRRLMTAALLKPGERLLARERCHLLSAV